MELTIRANQAQMHDASALPLSHASCWCLMVVHCNIAGTISIVTCTTGEETTSASVLLQQQWGNTVVSRHGKMAETAKMTIHNSESRLAMIAAHLETSTMMVNKIRADL